MNALTTAIKNSGVAWEIEATAVLSQAISIDAGMEGESLQTDGYQCSIWALQFEIWFLEFLQSDEPCFKNWLQRVEEDRERARPAATPSSPHGAKSSGQRYCTATP